MLKILKIFLPVVHTVRIQQSFLCNIPVMPLYATPYVCVNLCIAIAFIASKQPGEVAYARIICTYLVCADSTSVFVLSGFRRCVFHCTSAGQPQLSSLRFPIAICLRLVYIPLCSIHRTCLSLALVG